MNGAEHKVSRHFITMFGMDETDGYPDTLYAILDATMLVKGINARTF
jgi:hypothetical protein